MLFDDKGLVRVEEDGDKLKFLHMQNLDYLRKELEVRRKYQDAEGWSKDRTMRYIGSIPAVDIERNVGLRVALLSGDEVAIRKAVEIYFNSDDGREFCVNKMNTGKDAGVIVK